jgi:acyl carrier protein
MTHQEIVAIVSDIIRDVLDEPDLRITEVTSAGDVKAWDSFNHINIVVAIEGHFRLKFSTVDIESLRNVGELVRLIERKLVK